MTKVVLGPTGTRRRRWTLIAPFFVVALVGLMLAAGAQAVHDDGLFELDRNAVNEAAAGEDWNQVCPSNTPVGTAPGCLGGTTAQTSAFKTDDNRIYTGGSTKDDLDLPGWRHTAGSVPDKDELLHGYAARYGDHLYFGADRFANNGDAQIGVWFFQSNVGPLADGTFSGQHRDGDTLVLSDFTKGGEVSTIRVFRWNGPGGTIAGQGAIDGTLDLLFGTTASPQDCVGPPPLGAGDPACATVNQGNQNSPWSFTPKSGTANVFAKGEFYEGGIDLADPRLNLAGLCFSSVVLETRSSQSVDAVLKDFVSAGFEHCGANITIGPDAVNAVGDTHTFTVTVTKTVGSAASPVSGVKPSITLTASNGATLTNANEADCETTGTDATGTCEVTFTSSTAGIVTGHAEAAVVIDGNSFPVATGANSATGGPDAVKRFVDAKISLSPLTDTNGITEDHVVTATVQQDDGLAAGEGGDGTTGWANAPNGTTVSFSLLNNTANADFKPPAATSCSTASGSCAITITTATAGSVDIHASTTFSVGGKSLTRATGTGGNNSADANKVFIDGTLIWEKRANSATGALLGGAKFSVCRTHTWNSSTSAMDDTVDVCVGSGDPLKISDDESAPGGSGPNEDNDAASGKFKLTLLVLGRYVITETDAPAGYAKDPNPQTVDLTLSNPSNADNTAGDVVPVFVNQQLFKIIVLTCNQSLNELVASEVTIDGTTGDSIAGVPSGALTTKGVSESDLCAIGGAAKGNLLKNQDPGYSANVKVPKP